MQKAHSCQLSHLWSFDSSKKVQTIAWCSFFAFGKEKYDWLTVAALDPAFLVSKGFLNQRMIARCATFTWKIVEGVMLASSLPYVPVWSSETSQEVLTDTRQSPQLWFCPTKSNRWAEYKPYQALSSRDLQRIIKSCAMHTLDGHKCVSHPRMSQP